MKKSVVSKGTDGTVYEITIEKTDVDKGSVKVVTWRPGKPTGGKPTNSSHFKLYDIRAAANGSKLTCRADVFGPDPAVTFVLAATSITGTIAGALIGNGTNTYPAPAADIAALQQFIVDCKFPPL